MSVKRSHISETYVHMSVNLDVSANDYLEINAGGKIIEVKRATLMQLQGSKLEALFSGRWDKKLVKDSNGRLFFDVNSECFQAIVDYMMELALSSEEDPPQPPCVDDELKHILAHQMHLFGVAIPHPHLPDSKIIKKYYDAKILHDWIEEDEIGGEFELLYCSLRDGLSSRNIYSKCGKAGRELVVIETTEGLPSTKSGQHFTNLRHKSSPSSNVSRTKSALLKQSKAVISMMLSCSM